MSRDPRLAYFNPLRDHLASVIGESRLTRPGTVLEFGSGERGFIDLYSQPEQRGIALDVRDYSRAYPESIEFLISDGQTIDLPDGSVDLIVSHSVAEHLDNVPGSFGELDRVLKVGGIAYITVSPLYHAPQGSHVRTRPDWEHLDPGAGDFYLTDAPLGEKAGAFLNQYTLSDFLREFGRLPWDFLSMTRKHVAQEPPEHISVERDPIDLVTREFRLVAQKMGHTPAG